MALDRATDIRLKDGTIISVHTPGGGLVIVSTPPDDAAEATGLAAYRSAPIGTSTMATHSGMPVEVVRAYCRAHGGVAEIGETAQRLLRTLPSEADPVMGEPAPDSQPEAVEAAPESPLSPARGSATPGLAPAEAAARASDGPVVEPAPRLVLDELTEAVIEARRAVADFEGPLVWKKSWGRHRQDELPETAALWKRITRGSVLASRLIIVTHPHYALHPLLAEGIALRAQLTVIAEEARRERDAMAEADMRFHQRRNGVATAEA